MSAYDTASSVNVDEADYGAVGRRARSLKQALAHPVRGAARALLGQDMIFIDAGKIKNARFFNSLCSLEEGYLSPVT